MDQVPLSSAAAQWLAHQSDEARSRADLGSFGDDYEVVCAVRPEAASAIIAAALKAGVTLTPIGAFTADQGLSVRFQGRPVDVARTGWRHG